MEERNTQVRIKRIKEMLITFAPFVHQDFHKAYVCKARWHNSETNQSGKSRMKGLQLSSERN